MKATSGETNQKKAEGRKTGEKERYSISREEGVGGGGGGGGWGGVGQGGEVKRRRWNSDGWY